MNGKINAIVAQRVQPNKPRGATSNKNCVAMKPETLLDFSHACFSPSAFRSTAWPLNLGDIGVALRDGRRCRCASRHFSAEHAGLQGLNGGIELAHGGRRSAAQHPSICVTPASPAKAPMRLQIPLVQNKAASTWGMGSRPALRRALAAVKLAGVRRIQESRR